MAKRDYYEVLGVSKDAGLDGIKKAYRTLAIKYHPDRNPGDAQAEEQFKEATEAYDVLSDQKKRQAYDQFGFAGVDGLSGGGAQDFSHVFRDFEDIFGDFGGIFDSLFGGRRAGSARRQAGVRGDDLRYDLEIPFADAVYGTEAEISFARQEPCKICKGTGAEGGEARKLCPTCGGSGQVRRSSGFFSIASTCPECQGAGDVIDNPCHTCHGSGRERRNKRLKVTIPAGIEPGKRIQIPGQGDGGASGGPAGDLYVYIHVAAHADYERHGNDLYCVIPVGVGQASLGADIVVPTLDGKKVKVKVPPGTQSGKLLRLRNEGVPYLADGGRRGDLYIKVRVVTPTKLSSKAKSVLQEFADIVGEEGSPKPVPLSELE